LEDVCVGGYGEDVGGWVCLESVEIVEEAFLCVGCVLLVCCSRRLLLLCLLLLLLLLLLLFVRLFDVICVVIPFEVVVVVHVVRC